jgi:hypothetical protein
VKIRPTVILLFSVTTLVICVIDIIIFVMLYGFYFNIPTIIFKRDLAGVPIIGYAFITLLPASIAILFIFILSTIVILRSSFHRLGLFRICMLLFLSTMIITTVIPCALLRYTGNGYNNIVLVYSFVMSLTCTLLFILWYYMYPSRPH